ncbi:MAG: sugar phosphate isomerase/epimerase [Verrucomicrobia bacterium]|nr:sugar phosphate isomerase/epimerase [Verrucomicrobiota bacterium]
MIPAPDRLVASTLCLRQVALPAALALIKEVGLTAVDIGGLPGYCDHFDPRRTTVDSLAEWAEAVHRSGLRVHTLNVDVGAFNGAAESPELVLARARHCLAAARRVGAHGVTFSPGAPVDRTTRPLGAELAMVAGWFRQVAQDAAAHGLVISFEAPHRGGLIQNAAEAAALMAACDHPNARLVFDVGHHRRVSDDLPGAVRLLAPAIDHVHLKDQAGGKGCYPLGAGEVDFPGLFAALDRGGYRGCFALEFPDAAPTPAGVAALLRASLAYLERLRTASADHPPAPAAPLPLTPLSR